MASLKTWHVMNDIEKHYRQRKELGMLEKQKEGQSNRVSGHSKGRLSLQCLQR